MPLVGKVPCASRWLLVGVIVFGRIFGGVTVAMAQTSPVWTQYGPTARYSHSEVFDPSTETAIVFGGTQNITSNALNDVWVGSSDTRSLVFSALPVTGTLPAARYGHGATYDQASNRMTIFGGAAGSPATCMSDVWVLSDANGASGQPQWSATAIQGGSPGPRHYHVAGYDPTSNTLIVFGGSDCNGGFLNDVWVLSAANGNGVSTWTQLNPTGTLPPGRENATAIYDTTNNVLTVYGGDGAGGGSLGDVWTLSGANGMSGTPAWTQLSPGGTAPSARTGHSAVYDAVNNRMIIYGGFSGSKGTTSGETWVLSAANGLGPAQWTHLSPQGTVPNVGFQSAVYNHTSNVLYIFGGISSSTKLLASNHVFELSSANGLGGKPAWNLDGPGVRYSQSAFYDSGTNTLNVFGGAHAQTSVAFSDFWRQTGVVGGANLNWSRVDFTGSIPAARQGHTGAFDAASNRMMVFGGALGFPTPCTNDYWILTNANGTGGTAQWTATATLGTSPTARYRQASVYDPASNSLMIFGGSDCKAGYLNEVWVLSNANGVSGSPSWTHLQPTGAMPSRRESSTAVYDPATNVLIVFGGKTKSNHFGDVWLLSHANGQGGAPKWSQLVVSGSTPLARSCHTAIYDAVNNRMTIHGGYDSTNIFSDAWVLVGANGSGGSPSWTMLTPSDTAPGRRYHNAVYDPVSNEMFIFGGLSVTIPWTPEADIYSLTGANGLP